jgi:hypothetical protein
MVTEDQADSGSGFDGKALLPELVFALHSAFELPDVCCGRQGDLPGAGPRRPAGCPPAWHGQLGDARLPVAACIRNFPRCRRVIRVTGNENDRNRRKELE